jgi:Predicted small integral membrane protein (DUF2165)
VLITRYAKIVMSLVLAAFCLIVTFDNITDYGTNYLFVQHVMIMDTTFPGNTLMYRSITNPEVWRAAYAAIVGAEGIIGILFLLGAFRLFLLTAGKVLGVVDKCSQVDGDHRDSLTLAAAPENHTPKLVNAGGGRFRASSMTSECL